MLGVGKSAQSERVAQDLVRPQAYQSAKVVGYHGSKLGSAFKKMVENTKAIKRTECLRQTYGWHAES